MRKCVLPNLKMDRYITHGKGRRIIFPLLMADHTTKMAIYNPTKFDGVYRLDGRTVRNIPNMTITETSHEFELGDHL
jgi:hypothetical protein